jgi:hypothetical protein
VRAFDPLIRGISPYSPFASRSLGYARAYLLLLSSNFERSSPLTFLLFPMECSRLLERPIGRTRVYEISTRELFSLSQPVRSSVSAGVTGLGLQGLYGRTVGRPPPSSFCFGIYRLCTEFEICRVSWKLSTQGGAHQFLKLLERPLGCMRVYEISIREFSSHSQPVGSSVSTGVTKLGLQGLHGRTVGRPPPSSFLFRDPPPIF